MDENIKKYADHGDLERLKYIFVDSLDVDPTFVQYEEGYHYCKSKSGLLEKHMELTPFIYDEAKWTEEYWDKLKDDLLINFSDERMNHMREVAKVLWVEKVERLRRERLEREKAANLSKKNVTEFPVKILENTHEGSSSSGFAQEEQSPIIEAEKRSLAAENAEVERRMREQEERLKRRREEELRNQNRSYEGDDSKKIVGVAVVAIAVVAVALIMILK